MNKIAKFMQNKFLTGFAFISFNLIYAWVAFIISSISLWDFGRGISLSLVVIVNLNILIPVFAIVLYFKNKTYNNFKKVYRLFFGIEMPVISLCLLRMFLIREITPFVFVLLISFFVAILVQIVEYMNFKPLKKLKFMVLGYETTVILSVYALILSSFFILPKTAELIKEVFTKFLPDIINFIKNIDWANAIDNFIQSFTYFLLSIPSEILLFALIFFFISICVYIFITPFLSLFIYLNGFRKYLKRIADKKIVKNFAIIYIVLMAILSFQPNFDKFSEKIQDYKNANTYEQKIEIAQKSILPYQGIYKIFLTNKYLAKYRYFADNNYDTIKKIYNDTNTGCLYQNIFNVIARPFIFNGTFSASTANQSYQEIFDENIQFAQKKKIRKAVYSTLFNSETGATLLDNDEKCVLLKNRMVKVETFENLPIAKVQIIEEYKNKTTTDKEVYYEMTLPQGSVVTDLKLGDKLQYQGKISPKGAARQTYERQVVNKKDPALLEKTGLRQYTLRVFPVPSGEKQKVCYEYITLIHNGKVQLPDFYERRNVYENLLTTKKYSLNNGSEIKLTENFIEIPDQNISLPIFVKADNEILKLSKADGINDLKNKKIAVLLDTSYSNKTKWKDYLKKDNDYNLLLKQNTVDTYFFNELVSGKTDVFKQKQVNVGRTKKMNAIKYVSNKGYDLIIVLTDSSNFDNSEKLSVESNAPIYLIHKNGKIPPYFNELTNTIIKSNGDIEESIKDVINDYYEKNINSASSCDKDFIWQKVLNNKSETNENKEIKQLAASKIVDEKIKYKNLKDIKNLDEIHSLAKKEKIVTNYSSYIALVNKVQEEQLLMAEKSKNRYNADKKSGVDRFVNNLFDEDDDNDVKAVPEPEEWIMIILGLILLLSIVLYRKKYANGN